MGDIADMLARQFWDEWGDWTIDSPGREGEDRPSLRQRGPGECPRCDGETQLRTGKYGKFYGCKRFPGCTGSRSY
jgi:hypothetical protein